MGPMMVRTHALPPAPRILLLALLPLGDTIFTTPAVRALRERYPAARLTALVHASNAPLLHCVPTLNDVVVLPFRTDWAGAAPFAATLRRLRARRYDATIDFTTPAYKWVSFVAGIPTRTYMKFDPLWWLIPGAHQQWRATHATRHYYDCARELDLPSWNTVDQRPRLQLPPSARRDARRFMEIAHGLRGSGPLVGLHVGGAGLGGLKRWPAARFAALADRLAATWGARIVLLGGPDDRELATTVARMTQTRPLLAAGVVPLLTSIAIIEACDLFIGNDSGPLHAAAAVGTPYVGVFGPTSAANFQPIALYPGQGRVVRPTVPCRAPRYFVGGEPVWRGPCCRGVCAALATLDVGPVFDAAAILLSKPSLPMTDRRPDVARVREGRSERCV